MEINLFRFVLDFCALAVGKSGSPVTNLIYSLNYVKTFFLSVVAPNLYLKYYGANLTFKRGFFCDDPCLRYPKKEETYTGRVVWAVAMIVPLSTVSKQFFKKHN